MYSTHKDQKVAYTNNLQQIVLQKIIEQRLGRVESCLERIENTFTEMKDQVILDLAKIAREIAVSVVESLCSATDVGQLVVSKVKKKRLRRTQNNARSAREVSVHKKKKFKHQHKTNK